MHICLQLVQVLQLALRARKMKRAQESSQDEEMNKEESHVIGRTWFGEQVKEELEEDPTGSTGATESPHTIRIGPSKHGYVYTKTSEVLYKCSRGSDKCPTDHKLFLRKGVDGQWVAYDAPDNDSSPPMGNPIFNSYEDILVAGMHSWRIVEWKDGESNFMTTVLQTSSLAT